MPEVLEMVQQELLLDDKDILSNVYAAMGSWKIPVLS